MPLTTQKSLWEKIKDKQPSAQPFLKHHQIKEYQERLLQNPVQINSRAVMSINSSNVDQYSSNYVISPQIVHERQSHQNAYNSQFQSSTQTVQQKNFANLEQDVGGSIFVDKQEIENQLKEDQLVNDQKRQQSKINESQDQKNNDEENYSQDSDFEQIDDETPQNEKNHQQNESVQLNEAETAYNDNTDQQSNNMYNYSHATKDFQILAIDNNEGVVQINDDLRHIKSNKQMEKQRNLYQQNNHTSENSQLFNNFQVVNDIRIQSGEAYLEKGNFSTLQEMLPPNQRVKTSNTAMMINTFHTQKHSFFHMRDQLNTDDLSRNNINFSVKSKQSKSVLEQVRMKSYQTKSEFEPSSASYTVKGQFDKIQDKRMKLSKIEGHRQNLRTLWDFAKQTCQPMLVSKIAPPGPGQYIDTKKFSSLQRKGYSFSRDTRVFDKMRKEEIKNLYKIKEKAAMTTFMESTHQTLLNRSQFDGNVTISPVRHTISRSPDRNPASYSFAQDSRIQNVRDVSIPQRYL
ncbi:UNKNOWN [Stylonychia lemnae]|uniref:Uncharacterized protein n=1 Tax=Stylonychia lemnae TaxID=5949 RepID=A0A078AGJ3_STYLE|nr:UNKNOWN [Stylonychia lemnae]|eukprot:CDW79973.1 UNKNOWN [Stylonychia lemnae]